MKDEKIRANRPQLEKPGYTILTASTPPGLERQVLEMLSRGWRVTGGVAYVGGAWVQAMTKGNS